MTKKFNEEDINWFLDRLFKAGLMFYKRVGKYGQSSGAISVPRHMVGKIVKVVIIPLNAEEEYFVDPKKLKKRIKIDDEKIEIDLLNRKVKRLERRLNRQDPDLVNSELEKMNEIEDSKEDIKYKKTSTKDSPEPKDESKKRVKIDTGRKE